MKVHCDDGLARDLYDFFSFTVILNAKFMRLIKNRYWDGKVRLFSLKQIEYTLVFCICRYIL